MSFQYIQCFIYGNEPSQKYGEGRERERERERERGVEERRGRKGQRDREKVTETDRQTDGQRDSTNDLLIGHKKISVPQ